MIMLTEMAFCVVIVTLLAFRPAQSNDHEPGTRETGQVRQLVLVGGGAGVAAGQVWRAERGGLSGRAGTAATGDRMRAPRRRDGPAA